MEPPVLTDHGDWGPQQLCSPGPGNQRRHVVGVRLKIHSKQSFWRDDTGLNGIRLVCSGINQLLRSAEGAKGEWRQWTQTRNDAGITRVQLRSDRDSAADDAATTGLRFWDAEGEMYEPGDVDLGEWQDTVSCPPGAVILGLQTQVEEYRTLRPDNTGLNRVKFICG